MQRLRFILYTTRNICALDFSCESNGRPAVGSESPNAGPPCAERSSRSDTCSDLSFFSPPTGVKHKREVQCPRGYTQRRALNSNPSTPPPRTHADLHLSPASCPPSDVTCRFNIALPLYAHVKRGGTREHVRTHLSHLQLGSDASTAPLRLCTRARSQTPPSSPFSDSAFHVFPRQNPELILFLIPPLLLLTVPSQNVPPVLLVAPSSASVSPPLFLFTLCLSNSSINQRSIIRSPQTEFWSPWPCCSRLKAPCSTVRM